VSLPISPLVVWVPGAIGCAALTLLPRNLPCTGQWRSFPKKCWLTAAVNEIDSQIQTMSGQLTVPYARNERQGRSAFHLPAWFLIAAGLVILSVLVWQGIAAHGAPDPTVANTNRISAIFDIGVLVFREGLECILVLSAIMANMVGERESHRKPVVTGAGVGFLVTVVTWFLAVGIINDLNQSIPALDLQAGTGLLAVIVLLVVMNWFFHKVYWGGWICFHNKRKRDLQAGAKNAQITKRSLLWGLGLLGFSSLYREGFEVVLFLQSYYLKMGWKPVLFGAVIGLIFSGLVGVLTFVAHRRLPYRKMLVLTGTLLGVVLLVMVGEQAQEMQLAGWIPTTKIDWLSGIPDWAGVWFSVFPTVETLVAQFLAAIVVVGSYFFARRSGGEQAKELPA
jgi:high-affinity iron transporter